MFNSKTFTALMVVLLVLVAGSALAGAKLKINDDAYIDLGFRLQNYMQSMDSDVDDATDGNETMRHFSTRRARFRLKGVITPKVSIFLQTDVSTKDMQMIDAFVNYKADPWAQFIMGRNMAPSSRQAVTSSGALMAMDRPGLVYSALNWGARYKYGFNAVTYNGSGVPGTADAVRDNGLTLFGSGPLGDGNLKYYVGIYNGVQSGVDDKDHITFRAQYNLWDAEGGYYNSSTYLGKKKTLGIGFSYDTQPEVDFSTAPDPADDDILVDYTNMAIDFFLELPSSNGGALTAEAGWNSLDFDDAVDFMDHQGTGYYAQVGYYLESGFQPWFLYEAFSSDAEAIAQTTPASVPAEFVGKVPGDFSTIRVGATYYIDGQKANVKLGFESFKPDVPMLAGDKAEDTINSITLGFFTTY